MNKLAILFLSCVMCFSAQAKWTVDNSQSAVSFVSVKKQHIAESHRFDKISGELSQQGVFSLAIDLASVNTGISIRDERMQKHLFNTSLFPQANLSAQLDPKMLKDLIIGQTIVQSIPASLSLLAQANELKIQVMITKLSSDALLVNSVKPVIVNAKSTGLVAGIDKLAQLAGLDSIGYSVPVSFVLRLNK